METEITKDIIKKVEKIIELFDNYRGSSKIISDALKAVGKSQLEIAASEINNNPDRDKLFYYIKHLPQKEKNIIKALMEFGRDFDIASKKDFEFYIKRTRLSGDHEIDDMIAKPLSKYLKRGLIKLNLIDQIN